MHIKNFAAAGAAVLLLAGCGTDKIVGEYKPTDGDDETLIFRKDGTFTWIEEGDSVDGTYKKAGDIYEVHGIYVDGDEENLTAKLEGNLLYFTYTAETYSDTDEYARQ